jgi:DNA-binding MarR family transcriptional regulator
VPGPLVNDYGSPSSGIGLAARVIVHLSMAHPLEAGEMARIGRTQQGMASVLDVPQSSLVRVLQRLEAGRAVVVESRFVLESNRRMKVYLLTPLGQSLARDLLNPKSNLSMNPR